MTTTLLIGGAGDQRVVIKTRPGAIWGLPISPCRALELNPNYRAPSVLLIKCMENAQGEIRGMAVLLDSREKELHDVECELLGIIDAMEIDGTVTCALDAAKLIAAKLGTPASGASDGV